MSQILKEGLNAHKCFGKRHCVVDSFGGLQVFDVLMYGPENGVMENEAGEGEMSQILKED